MKRPIVIFATAFLLCTFLLTYCNNAVAIFLAITAFIGITALFILKFALKNKVFKKENKLFVRLALVFSAIFLSSISYVTFILIHQTDVSKFDAMPISCKAVIEERATKADNSICYTVSIKETSKEFDKLLNKKAIFYSNTETVFNYHDLIEINATCKVPTKSNGFDLQAYYAEHSILIMFNQVTKSALISPAKSSIMTAVKNLSEKLKNQTDKLLKAPYSGLLQAMLLGDTSDIDMYIMHDIQKSGISHAFSVSGMHISILSGILLAFLAFFPLSLRLKNSIAIVFVWLLVMITGMGIPACRSGIMTTLFLSAPFFKRQSDGKNSLIFSACLLIMNNPLAIKSPSFLLTFSATAGVIMLSDKLSSFIIKHLAFNKNSKNAKNSKSRFLQGLKRGFSNVISPSLAATITIFPISTIFFGGVSIISPITNFLLVPIFPLVLLGGILLLISSYIPFLSALVPIFSTLIESSFAFMIFVCKNLSALKWAYIGLDFDFISIWLFLFTALFLCYIFLRKRFDKIRLAKVALFGFSILIMSAAFNSYLTHDDIIVEAFSSSKGATAVVLQGRKAVVISIADDKQSDKNALTFLQNKNVNSLECYIELNGQSGRLKNSIAHRDRDLLFLNYPPKYVLPSQKYNFKINDGYKINDILTAFYIDSGKGVLLSYENERILFTADFLVAQNVKCDILYFCGDYKPVIAKNNADKIVFLSGPLNDTQKIYKNT